MSDDNQFTLYWGFISSVGLAMASASLSGSVFVGLGVLFAAFPFATLAIGKLRG